MKQTQKNNLYLILFFAILFAIVTLTGCVSAKKYKALEADYQRAGEELRNATHERDVLKTDKLNQKGGKQ